MMPGFSNVIFTIGLMFSSLVTRLIPQHSCYTTSAYTFFASIHFINGCLAVKFNVLGMVASNVCDKNNSCREVITIRCEFVTALVYYSTDLFLTFYCHRRKVFQQVAVDKDVAAAYLLQEMKFIGDIIKKMGIVQGCVTPKVQDQP